MKGRPARTAIILAIIKKDLKEFTRDRMWAILTLLSLVSIIVLFWVLPGSINETITLGVHQTGLDGFMERLIKEHEGALIVRKFDSSEELLRAVKGELRLEKDMPIGLDFPADFRESLLAGRRPAVRLYLDAAVPVEIRQAMSSFVREMAHELMGDEIPVTPPDESTVILGKDRAGNQIPFRVRLLPILVFLILLMESLALASLIANEIQSRTITALLVSPARSGDILTAKALFGSFLAFSQTFVLLLAVGGLGHHALQLVVILFLGSLMVSGVGMLIGSAGKDFMGTLLLGMLMLIPLGAPAFAAIFPGSASPLIKVIPSFSIVKGLAGIAMDNMGWADCAPYMGLAALWVVVILGAGFFILKRRAETL
jgi:ABC-2 type transport system permease protein